MCRSSLTTFLYRTHHWDMIRIGLRVSVTPGPVPVCFWCLNYKILLFFIIPLPLDSRSNHSHLGCRVCGIMGCYALRWSIWGSKRYLLIRWVSQSSDKNQAYKLFFIIHIIGGHYRLLSHNLLFSRGISELIGHQLHMGLLKLINFIYSLQL